MPTVQQMQQFIRQAIQAAFPEPEAGAVAQQVLAHVLDKSRVQLSLSQQEAITAEQQAKIEQSVQRLQQQEPVQYVLGIAHFYGMDLQVDERVLIPRPETEELVDLVLKEHHGKRGLKVLDICTGSGCIPLALAGNLQEAEVYGLEVSAGALEVARENAVSQGLPITWLQQDVFEPIVGIADGSVDVITSNPPYVLEEEKEQMRLNVLQFEPHLALFVPNTEALKYYIRITIVAQQLLKKGGILYFEINERFGKQVLQLVLDAEFAEATVIQDFFGKDRIVRAMK